MKTKDKRKQDANQGLVPNIRFPEFQNAGEWKIERLGDYIEQYSERVPSSTDLDVYSSTRDGLKPQKEYYNGRQIVNDGEYGIVPNGYFVYRHMSDDDIFKFNINTLGEKIAVSKEYPVFKTVNLVSEFLINKLNEGIEFKRFAASQKKGGTRTRLYFKTLCSFECSLPSFQEQQKIADCLCTLDELLAAQADKLDILKAHKKGLMQKLFPTPGQTTPILRFPEFQEAEEWKVRPLGKTLLKSPEYGINAPAVPYSKNLPTYLRITDISEDGSFLEKQKVSVAKEVFADNYLHEGDIALARTGASVGKAYKYRKKDGELVFAGFLIRIRPDQKKLNTEFLFHSLSTEQYWAWVSCTSVRGGQPGINGKEYASLPVSLPPTMEEQTRIADCFSSLDELIAAQAHKLDILKDHKKGLIQQLFPVPDGVRG